MSLRPGITVVIPTIPPRTALLNRAAESVAEASSFLVDAKLSVPVEIITSLDVDHTGSAATRNRALAVVDTEWVAWLDDDDEFLPHHLATLYRAAQATGADVVYSLPRVLDHNGRKIPRQPDWGGGPEFDPELLRRKAHIQTTSLMRTERAQAVGGFAFIQDETGAVNDDHGIYLALLDAGAKFAHVHEETFIWRHHGYGTPGVSGNTSGQGSRW